MSITSSMYTGAAGLGSHSDAMGIISDNIANVNTVGYKSSRANFSDILGGMIAGSNTGNGSVVGNVQTLFGEGSLLGTGNATDLAISGDGFFVVNGNVDGVAGNYYTRAGQFHLDNQGFLVNADGLRVQGLNVDTTGNLGTTVGDLLINGGTIPPTATQNVSLDANLDADRAVDATPFNIADPSGTSDWSTSVTVYDSLGTAHQMTMFFKKTADAPTQNWDVHVAVAGSDVTPAVATDFTEVGTGTLSFDANGALTSNTLGTVNVAWAGAAGGTIDLNLGSPTATGGTGVDGITAYATESGASAVDQDGNSTGQLTDYQVLTDGTVQGRYSNGESRALAQLSTATFRSVDGLQRRGGSLFSSTIASGDAVMGTPGEGGFGSIQAGNLEASNVDLAHEFVSMITIQRGFQGNSRTITTADEMLTEVVSLKR